MGKNAKFLSNIYLKERNFSDLLWQDLRILVRPKPIFEESDLDVEQLTAAAFRAIEDWLDEDTVEFEPDEG